MEHIIKSELRNVCSKQCASLAVLLSCQAEIFSRALQILIKLSPWNWRCPSCLSTQRVSQIPCMAAPSSILKISCLLADALANATTFLIVPDARSLVTGEHVFSSSMVNVGNVAVEAEASAIQLFSCVVVVGEFFEWAISSLGFFGKN